MAAFRTLDALNPAGKRVVVRSDLNVPVKDGKVTDTTRIDRSAETLRELADKGGRVIVVTHFGRPKGREAKYSQKLLVEPLAKALGRPVVWVDDVVGPEAEKAAAALKDGEVLLTETSASTLARKATTLSSRSSWRSWATFMSTTLSPPPIARMPPPPPLRSSCPPMPGG